MRQDTEKTDVEVVRRLYTKKPITVEAIRLDKISNEKVIEFMGGEGERNISFSINNRTGELRIHTREGTMTAMPGDWVIKEPHPTSGRRYYPCKPDIFEATYSPALPEGEVKGVEGEVEERLLRAKSSCIHPPGCGMLKALALDVQNAPCTCGCDDARQAIADALAKLEALQASLKASEERVRELTGALQIIAGERQCLDNLMGDKDVARAALHKGEA